MRSEQTAYEAMTTDIADVEPMRRFGRLGKPIPATEAYRRIVSTLIRNGIRVEKWILINERDHIVTYVTTYNGITGAHFDAVQNTHWLSWDAVRSKILDYRYVATDECPIARPISRLSQSTTQRRSMN